MAGKEDQIKTTIAVEGEKEYKKACKEIDASLKAIASEMKVVSATFEGNADSIEAMTAKQDVLNKRLEEQKRKVAETEAALKRYQNAGLGGSEAAKKLETSLNYAKAAMIKTQNEVNQLDKELTQAKNATNGFEGELRDVADEAEKTGGELDGLGSKVSSVAGALGKGLKVIGAGVAAIGTALAAGLAGTVKFADEAKSAMNDFESATGIANAAANGFEDAMMNIYENNFGENLEDIAAAMATVAQTSGEVDPTKIEALSQNALMLRDAFGFDVQEQMRAVNMLMDQFGISGEEAFNLIAQGAQNGLDKNGDLLDSINEYAVHFKSLGLDAEEMFNSFVNGADAGTFSVDKLGDAVKEFGIRVKDGSDSTMQAFESIGLSADDMAAAFAAGGDEAAKAFDDVTKALFAMDDPLAQNTAGVALFGTMWEDLGVEGMRALTQLNGEISNTTDALSAINEVKYDDLGSAIKGLGRIMKTGFVLPIGNEVLPAFSDFVNEVSKGAKEANGDISKMANVFGDALEGLTEDLADVIPKITEIAGKMVMGLIKGIGNSLPKLATAATDLVTTMIEEIVDMLPEFLKAGVEAITNIIKGIAKALPELIPAIIDAVLTMVETLIENIPMLIEAGIELILGLAEGILKAIPQIIKMIPKLIQSLVDALIDGIPMIMEGAVELFTGIISAIPQIVVELVAAIPQIIGTIVKGLIDGVDAVISAAAELFFGIVDEGRKAREEIVKNAEAVTPFVDALNAAQPSVAEYTELLSNYGRTLGEIDDAISETETAITDILAQALQNQNTLREEDLENIRRYMDELNALQQEKLQIYRDQQIAALRKLQLEKDQLQQEDAAQHLANTQAALDAANTATEEAYTAQLTIIENKYKAMNEIGSAAYLAEQEQAKQFYHSQLAENQAYADEAIGIVQTTSNEWVAADAAKWAELSQGMAAFNNETENGFNNFMINAGDWLGSFNWAKDQYAIMLSEMDLDSANAFLSMAANVKAGGGEISESTKQTAADMLASFDNLPAGLDEVGKDALLGIIKGMDTYIPELANTSDMTANEIVDTIKAALGIASPSVVLTEVGGFVVQGLIQGMTAQQEALNMAIMQIAETIKLAFSTLPEEFTLLGGQLAQALSDGLIVGISALPALIVEQTSALFATMSTTIAQNITTGISTGISTGTPAVTTAVMTLIENVLTNFTTAATRFHSAGMEVMKQVSAGVTAGAPNVATSVKNMIESTLSSLAATAGRMNSAGREFMTNVAAGISAGNPSVTAAVKRMIEGVLSDLAATAGRMKNAGMDLMKNVAAGIVSAIPQVTGKIPQVIQAVITAMSNQHGRMRTAGVDLDKQIASGMVQGIPQITSKVPQIVQSIITAFTQQHSKFVNEGVELDKQIASGMVQGIPDITAKVPQIVQPVITALRSYISEFTAAGEDMVRGIWTGFQNMSGWLESKVRSMMKSIVSAVKSEMKISSPSKVFEGIGAFMAEGLGSGFAREVRNVEKTIRNATASTVPKPDKTSGRIRRGEDLPRVQVVQNIYAQETSYARQQREAAKNFRMIAREVMA